MRECLVGSTLMSKVSRRCPRMGLSCSKYELKTIWVGNTRADAAQSFHVSALLLSLRLEVEHKQRGVGTPLAKDRLPSVSGFRCFQTSGWVLFPR